MFSPRNVFAGNNIIVKEYNGGNAESGICLSTGPKRIKVKLENNQVWAVPYSLILAADNSSPSDQPQMLKARVGQKIETTKGNIYFVDKVNPTRYAVTSYTNNQRYTIHHAAVTRVFD